MEFRLFRVIVIEHFIASRNFTDRSPAPHKCTPTIAALVGRAPDSLIIQMSNHDRIDLLTAASVFVMLKNGGSKWERSSERKCPASTLCYRNSYSNLGPKDQGLAVSLLFHFWRY